MKSVCLCYSFKFHEYGKELQRRLMAEGIDCDIPGTNFKYRKSDSPGEYTDDFASATTEDILADCKRMADEHLAKIDKTDITYILAVDGYFGLSVSGEIFYAYGRGKDIYTSEPLKEHTPMSLTKGVMTTDELIEYCKEN